MATKRTWEQDGQVADDTGKKRQKTLDGYITKTNISKKVDSTVRVEECLPENDPEKHNTKTETTETLVVEVDPNDTKSDSNISQLGAMTGEVKQQKLDAGLAEENQTNSCDGQHKSAGNSSAGLDTDHMLVKENIDITTERKKEEIDRSLDSSFENQNDNSKDEQAEGSDKNYKSEKHNKHEKGQSSELTHKRGDAKHGRKHEDVKLKSEQNEIKRDHKHDGTKHERKHKDQKHDRHEHEHSETKHEHKHDGSKHELKNKDHKHDRHENEHRETKHGYKHDDTKDERKQKDHKHGRHEHEHRETKHEHKQKKTKEEGKHKDHKHDRNHKDHKYEQRQKETKSDHEPKEIKDEHKRGSELESHKCKRSDSDKSDSDFVNNGDNKRDKKDAKANQDTKEKEGQSKDSPRDKKRLKDSETGESSNISSPSKRDKSSIIKLSTPKKYSSDQKDSSGLKEDVGVYKHPHTKHDFVFFFGMASPFSQFHPAKFVVESITYSCAEQYMMHQKAVTFGDKEIGKQILAETKPLKMKRLGRKVRNFNPKIWGDRCVEIVKEGNIAKFSQNGNLEKELFASYPKVLAECSPRDRLWGIGMGATNPLAWDMKNWRGKNLLGFALMDVRYHLMKMKRIFK